MLIGLVAEEGGEEEEERESHSKVGTLLGPTNRASYSLSLFFHQLVLVGLAKLQLAED